MDFHTAHARMTEIVGRWRTEGHLVDDPTTLIRGTDTYRLLAGGHFLIHEVDVTVGDVPVIAIEVIGEFDPAHGSFVARAFDNDGAVTVMRAAPDEPNVWRFTGGGDVAPAAQTDATEAVRSTLRIAEDGQRMHARWERSSDGDSWRPWMDIGFTRLP
ncbi:DUF1579 domain-containing protein [Phytoactinopolyspora alkaliphila]|uniref:DUF1579 domain-containing protein n=1 Tax=Phytoactinopolyspora alkaliphila TaxID=1783498 RepID=A0A6N9YKA7_9ACTN|nr:DUF1579 family protein [Phytoactinopolyspora alkaliphila]NED95433.1 DUF1579 domain-containing protein [Phytoactinopolyspora alkaliphila]